MEYETVPSRATTTLLMNSRRQTATAPSTKALSSFRFGGLLNAATQLMPYGETLRHHQPQEFGGSSENSTHCVQNHQTTAADRRTAMSNMTSNVQQQEHRELHFGLHQQPVVMIHNSTATAASSSASSSTAVAPQASNALSLSFSRVLATRTRQVLFLSVLLFGVTILRKQVQRRMAAEAARNLSEASLVWRLSTAARRAFGMPHAVTAPRSRSIISFL